jgi:polysaccharide biosynthesis/export protein
MSMSRRVAAIICAAIVCIAGRSVSNGQVSSASAVGAQTSATSKSEEPRFQERDQRYQIQPGDSFDVNFDLSPEFDQTSVAVQPDGFVTLRGIGDIKVQGQTVPQLIETLRLAYGKILHDPIISVVLKDFQKPYFIADGQVARPGKYDLRADTTLTEAIAIAGGFTESSKHSQVLLFRRINAEWTSAKLFNVKQMEKTGDLHEDPFLHPGDMVFVPKNRMSKIRAFIPSSGVNAIAGSF